MRHVQSRHLALYQLGPVDDLDAADLSLAVPGFEDESRLRPDFTEMTTFSIRADILPDAGLTLVDLFLEVGLFLLGEERGRTRLRVRLR